MPKRAAHGIELLADPTRRRMIALLAIRPHRPTTLAREIGLSRPAVSRQLRLLREAGLVERYRSFVDRRALIYRISRERHGVITAWLAGTEVGRPTVEFDGRGLPRLG
ncbi:MAG TPA: metalloregulator ArsR/SmtB family transcription factor [Candidatus Limnocylindrales bacterium]|nr:metalloregulator ArsR/SmtB family transcription factor [Candidatus Limnocylindrales bacterium]